jgi:hypothetical protein
MRSIPITALALLAAGAAEAQIRNAPPPRSLETAAYIYAVTNVCGFRIRPDPFRELFAKQGVTPDLVALRGPFGHKIQSMFVVMSNGLAQNRDAACAAAWTEFGRDGSVAAGLLEPG